MSSNPVQEQNNAVVDIETPSFIRLFVIRRIIDKYIKNRKNQKDTKVIIKDLANVFIANKTIESLVINILTRLINEGLKEYMAKYYNEKKEANIIEDIFNKIILKKFAKEYYQLIEYKANIINNEMNDTFCQTLVFNSSDLMCKIFHYLEYGEEFDQDLFACSLVNSHWLYNSWNVNCVYHVDLEKLFKQTSKYNKNEDNIVARMWQRLIHVKSMYLSVVMTDDVPSTVALNKLSTLTKCEKMNVRLYTYNINDSKKVREGVSRVLMTRYTERCKHCTILISSSSENEIAPLHLANAQYIEISDKYCYRIWTNRCTWLKLLNEFGFTISKDWCNFVINNCDCSNINTLILNAQFDTSIDESILKQFASKFINLKKFRLEFFRIKSKSLLLFWKLLMPTILKNNVQVEVELYRMRNNELKLLNDQIKQEKLNCKLKKLMIKHVNDYEMVDETIEFLQDIDKDNGGDLNHLVIDANITEIYSKVLNQVLFKSINVLEILTYIDFDLSYLIDVMGSNKMVEKEFLLIVNVTVGDRDNDYRSYNYNPAIISLFKQLCQNISQKLFVEQIAIDIKVSFNYIQSETVFNKYLSIYSSYFENEDYFSHYKQPKCNNHLCLPRVKPYTYFYINEKCESCVFRVTNVNYV